jgi:carbon monoxide dehydrogenase subunit G
MKLEGSVHSPLAPSELWDALRDPQRLADALPGVRLVDVIDVQTFRAFIEPATGLGVTPLELDVRIDDERAGEHVSISGAGRSGEQLVELEVEIDVSGRADGTAVEWNADVRFFGLLSSIGQRVLPHIAADMIESALQGAAQAEPV